MHNHWFPAGPASALNPCSTSSVDKPNPPPDPPDPSSNLSVQNYPPLSSSLPPLPLPLLSQPLAKVISSEISLTSSTTDVVMTQIDTTPVLDVQMTQADNSSLDSPDSTIQNPRSKTTVHQNYIVVLPKATSPLLTNPASFTGPRLSPSAPTTKTTEPTSEQPNITLQQRHSSQSSVPPLVVVPPQPVPLSLAERIRRSEDKSLHKVSNVEISESSTGRPRIKIPDSVFKKGAELHKEFVVGYFSGRTPAFGAIQSVESHLG